MGWLREPVWQFLALGAALFLLHRLVRPSPRERIEVPAEVVAGLVQDHVRRTGARPTPAEREGLVRRYIDDEVLYRTALAEGLDRGDVIVRRRLIQKMEFVTESALEVPEPTEAALAAHVEQHQSRYALPARLSLVQVFVRRERAAEAAALLARLEQGAAPEDLGDPFLHGQRFSAQTEEQLAGRFGAGLAARLFALPAGRWAGPLPSPHGLHLVRVTERQEGRPARLPEVRERAREDWLKDQRARLGQAALARLRERFEVRVAPEVMR
jgi:hypothetical protein